MVQCSPQTREMQEQRLKIKQLGQQMQNLATEGAGLSPWEARELVRLIDDFFSGSGFETNPAKSDEIFVR